VVTGRITMKTRDVQSFFNGLTVFTNSPGSFLAHLSSMKAF